VVVRATDFRADNRHFVCFVLIIVRYLSSFQNSSGGAGGVVKCDVDLGPRRGFAR
jgi:hypothetical protein